MTGRIRAVPLGPEPMDRIEFYSRRQAELLAELVEIQGAMIREAVLAGAKGQAQAESGRWLRAKEVARLLGFGESKVYELHASGVLPGIVPEGSESLRWESRDVEEYMARSRRASGQ